MQNLLFWIVAIVLSIKCITSLRNVKLSIQPKVIERFGRVVLDCSYELADDVLYSVKFYRGFREFYRYTPSETPSIKIFPLIGIDVDLSNSNSTQVTLRDVDFSASGKFACEVTTELLYSILTEQSTSKLEVVKLPDFPPTISVGGEPLDYGDILRANCSSSPSKPRATLTFLLNNITVANNKQLETKEPTKPTWSDLSLELELSDHHFNSDGRLILQCIADVEGMYHEDARLHLVSVRDPVPERVSAANEANIFAFAEEIVCLAIGLSILLS